MRAQKHKYIGTQIQAQDAAHMLTRKQSMHLHLCAGNPRVWQANQGKSYAEISPLAGIPGGEQALHVLVGCQYPAF